jgi:4-aminobutyrate--pyruvate transaminase
MTHAPNSPAAIDVAYQLHPYTNLAVHEDKGPFIITRGEGIYVFDDDGKRYIEGLAGLWCTSLGFSEPRLVQAAKRQMETLPYSHTFTHRSTLPTIELAEKLISIAPAPLTKAYFVNSGSEAVDTAIKLVWYYNNAHDRPEKKKIISRRRAYHGVTVAAGSLTALPYVWAGFDLPRPGFLQTDTPCMYRDALPGESEDDFSTRLAASLEALIEAEGPETVGGFIAEPVMGAGGVIVPPVGYFDKIQQVLKRHDVLMIADEVICGFGRTGNVWGCQTYGIAPPIGAVAISEPVYQAFVEQSRKHGMFGTGNTYGGHPVAAAVALETLKIYQERDILGHVRHVAGRFQSRLKALAGHPLVGDARGVGLIGAVEIVADKASKESFPVEIKAALQVTERARENGLILRPLPGDSVGICPPLIITEAEIDDLFDRLARALDGAQEALVQAAA